MFLLVIAAVAGELPVKPETVDVTIKMRTLDGIEKMPFHFIDEKATVFLFINPDCPITNRSVPEIRRIVKDFAARPVAFTLVYADPALTRKEIKDHLKTNGLSGCEVFVDENHVMAKTSGATVTPEVVVTNATGHILYRGRINDAVAEISKPWREPTQHDLRDALAAILRNEPVAVPRTQPVGCYIPDVH